MIIYTPIYGNLLSPGVITFDIKKKMSEHINIRSSLEGLAAMDFFMQKKIFQSDRRFELQNILKFQIQRI